MGFLGFLVLAVGIYSLAKKTTSKKMAVGLMVLGFIIMVGSSGGGTDSTVAPKDTGQDKPAVAEPKPNEEKPSPKPAEPKPEPPKPEPVEDKTTIGERNALKSAKNYLSMMAFSKSGLAKQLEFEGYSEDEAEYAVENCGADWNEQAALSAENYLDTMSFSKQGLIDQLMFEGFSKSQAEYGVKAVGY